MLSTSNRKITFQAYYLKVGQENGTTTKDSEMIAKAYFEAYGYVVLRSKEESDKVLATGILQNTWKDITKIFIAGIPDLFVYKIEKDNIDWFFVEVKKITDDSDTTFTRHQLKWYLQFSDYFPIALCIIEYLSIKQCKEETLSRYAKMNLQERQEFLALQTKINADVSYLTQANL